MADQHSNELEAERLRSEIERIKLESEKLRLDIDSSRRGPAWDRWLSTLLQASVAGVVAGALIFAFLSDHLVNISEIADRSLEASQEEAEKAAREMSRLAEEKKKVDAYNAKLSQELAQAIASAEQLRSQATAADSASAAESAQATVTSLHEIDISHLLTQMNGENRDLRRAAVNELIDRYEADPRAIELSLGELETPEELTPPGRYNVLYFLAATAESAWSTALVARAEDALDGLGPVGKQTQNQIAAVRNRLD